MNELSNKVLSKLSNLKDFSKNKPKRNMVARVDPLDIKMFYIFDIIGN